MFTSTYLNEKHYNSINESGWYYLDDNGNARGPFDTEEKCDLAEDRYNHYMTNARQSSAGFADWDWEG